MAEAVLRYTFRLRPGVIAERYFLAEWGRCRWLWNEAVHQQRAGERPTFKKLSLMLTEARARNAWLREGSSVAQQQVLRNYSSRLSQWFTRRHRGLPRQKKRKNTLPSLEYTRSGFTVAGRRLRLPGGITIPVVWSRELPSEPSSVRVYRDNMGHWYGSFVVRAPLDEPREATGSIGIDWGVAVTATATDPEFDFPYQAVRLRSNAETAKAQRKVSRRFRPGVKQSRGYYAAKKVAARRIKKASRRNRHEVRAWAKRVVDHHFFIAIEDVSGKWLARGSHARRAQDAAIGIAKRELIERGRRAGREVVLVPPAYTTMTCAECGTRAKERLALDVRTFRCQACGFTACRDRNAARVVLVTAERNRAGADDVRHATAPIGAGSNAVRARKPVLGRR